MQGDNLKTKEALIEEILNTVKGLPQKEQQDLWNYLVKNGFIVV